MIVVAAIVLLVWQPWRTASAPPAATSPTQSAAANPSASGTPSAPASPSPSATATTAEPCRSADLSVFAVTNKDTYAADEQPQLSITLSNEGPACLIDVGTSTQQYEVTSGSDTWWRSTDCQAEPTEQVVELAAGQTVSSQEPLVWDRTRSSVDTCGEDDERPAAQPGTYNLQVSIGGIEAADTKSFVLQ